MGFHGLFGCGLSVRGRGGIMGGMSAEKSGYNGGRRIFFRYVVPTIAVLSLLIALLLNWATGAL
jgi:hypothetical protein